GMSANPSVPTMLPGITGSSQITASSQNGFSGTVLLSTTSTSQCNLSTLSLVVPGSAASTLACSFPSAGRYTVVVMGRSGPDSRTVQVNFVVQDFSLSTSPNLVVSNPGMMSSSTISAIFLNGFSGTVTLAVTTNSTSLSCSLGSSIISGVSGTTTLSCAGSASGNYTATVTGSSGTLLHSTTVLYQVQDLSVSASLTSLTVNAGVAGTSIIAVSSLNGFAGTVALAITTN